MKKSIFILLVAVLFAGSAFAYDETLARTYEGFFASSEGQQVPKALHLISPEKVVEAIKKRGGIVLLDVRTRKEQSIIELTFGDTLSLPMDEVFRAKNLAKMPDRQESYRNLQVGSTLHCNRFGNAQRWLRQRLRHERWPDGTDEVSRS